MKHRKIVEKVKAIMVMDDQTRFEIEANKDGMASLTDIWKMAGKPSTKRPIDWLHSKEAMEFVAHIRTLKGGNSHLLDVRVGRSGGTYADLQIALKYAQYVSPEFQRQVNDVFLERVEEERDPELGIRRAVERHTKRLRALGRDELAIQKRLKTVEKRNTLTSTLAEHGVTGGWRSNGFAQVTEAEYVGWKGKGALQIKRDLGLGPKDNLRDHLPEYDLDQLAFLEATLEQTIARERLWGNQQCAAIANRVGKEVHDLVSRLLPHHPQPTESTRT